MKRQPRSVTVTYGAVSAALVVVVATVALIVKPPSPPALAEFAPQAESTIEESAEDQSSRFGSGGDGACRAGQVGCEGFGTPPPPPPPPGAGEGDDPTAPGATPVDGARVRRCVGDPPRQIEDPQSPPCAPYWDERDNGGATSKGVTAHEIRVAVAARNRFIPLRDLQGLADFFNRRFELYGRRLTLVDMPPYRQDPKEQRAAAEGTAEARVFAAVATSVSDSMPLRTRLAQLGVVGVLPDANHTEADLRALHPYAWGYNLSFDRLARDLGEFACASLVGDRARYGGLDVSDKARSFAVVAANKEPSTSYGDPEALAAGLRACKAPVSVHVYDEEEVADRIAQRQLLERLRDDGVTTLIPVQRYGASPLMETASEMGYQPEWLLPGGGDPFHLHESGHQYRPADQAAHMFAVGGWNKSLPERDRPSRWAFDEAGVPLQAKLGAQIDADMWYRGLLVLASGIQAAGPNLTPETFARGLQGLRFPNPGAGAAPYYQASVGFTGDHTMVDDETVQWWSAAAPAHYSSGSPAGGWCYVERGARWRTGRWPRLPADALFNPSKPCQ